MVAKTTATKKAKGIAFQKDVKASLVSILGINPDDILSTPSGVPGCDLYLSPEARKKFDFGIECKRQEPASLVIYDALSQCITNAQECNRRPLLVFRRNNHPAFVALRRSDFQDMQNLATRFRFYVTFKKAKIKSFQIYDALDQCVTRANEAHSIPLLVFFKDGIEPFVALRLSDFLSMQLQINQANDPQGEAKKV